MEDLIKQADKAYAELQEHAKKYPHSRTKVIASDDLYDPKGNRNEKCKIYQEFAHKFNRSIRYSGMTILYAEGRSELFTDFFCEVFFEWKK